jgi:two-component system, OmpR family, manganese sensing sensor histidine kinase
MFQATQRRLALWYTTITAVLLLIFASGFFLYVRSTLIERVDDTLNHVVEVVQRSLVLETSSSSNPYQINLEASFRSSSDPDVEDDRIDLEWFTPDGKLAWSTLEAPLALPLQVDPHTRTVQSSPEHWIRQITESLQVQGQLVGYLRVSHPWFEVTRPTEQLMIDLLLGTSFMVGLVAASGWFLSRLAMEPIRESYQYLKQFTADASHELRNPVALIQTNVQVALREPELELPQRQQLEVVERLTRRLGKLIDDLLFLTRQDSGIVQPQFQPCPLDALVMEVVDEQRTIAQAKQIIVTLEIADPERPSEPEPFTLAGDYDQLVRLFTNLVSNGIQYSPAQTQIQLRLKSLTRQGLPWLQVDVTDQGEGIPAEALPHIFERFFRIDPARSKSAAVGQNSSGTGLGLAIVQAIVQNHQGQVRVQSQPGQGTTFTVLLPQHQNSN